MPRWLLRRYFALRTDRERRPDQAPRAALSGAALTANRPRPGEASTGARIGSPRDRVTPPHLSRPASTPARRSSTSCGGVAPRPPGRRPRAHDRRRVLRHHPRHDRRRHPLRRRRRHGRRPGGRHHGLHHRQPAHREGVAADEYSGVAIAGAAGPAVEMVKLFQVQLEHYEKIEGETLSLEGKADPARADGAQQPPRGDAGLRGGAALRRLRPTCDRGRVFSYDVTGGKYEEADFQTNGSGGVHARNWIKASWTEGMARDDAIDLSLRSLFAAADENTATGGPDLIRRIFPTVAVISADGFTGLPPRRRRHPSRVALRRPRGGERAVSMPFYVPPEQMMKDHADYARKGIARGRSLVAFRRGRTASCSSPRTRSARSTRSRRSTTASRSPGSASTTSSRCSGSPACARPTSRATRSAAPKT